MESLTQTVSSKIQIDTSQVIGVGTYGTKVFKGTYMGKQVAVKVVYVKKQGDAFLEEYKNLIEILSDVGSSNVIKIYDIERIDNNSMQLAIEYCDATLADYRGDGLKKNKESFCRQLITGLHFLHTKNIVHGDLTPSNVLLQINDGIILKIADFEMSKLLPNRLNEILQGSAGIRTTEWLAPELLRIVQDESRDTRIKDLQLKTDKTTDIFAMGCLLFYIITGGLHPYGKKLLREFNILNDKKNFRLAELTPNLFPVICFLQFALSQEPDNRPKTDDAMFFPSFWEKTRDKNFFQSVHTFLSANLTKPKKELTNIYESMNSYIEFYHKTKSERIPKPLSNVMEQNGPEIVMRLLDLKLNRAESGVKSDCQINLFWLSEHLQSWKLILYFWLRKKRTDAAISQYYQINTINYPHDIIRELENYSMSPQDFYLKKEDVYKNTSEVTVNAKPGQCSSVSKLVVGGKDCTFQEIAKIFMNKPVEIHLRSMLAEFGKCLGEPPDIVLKFQTKMEKHKKTADKIVKKILKNWQSRNNNEGTIGKLLEIVRRDLDWKQMTDFLQDKLIRSAKNWNDLDEWTKQFCRDSKIRFQGGKPLLGSLLDKMTTEAFNRILEEHFDSKILSTMWARKAVRLDIPLDELQNYIPRTLLFQREVNMEPKHKCSLKCIAKCTDIFVFEGIDHTLLARFVYPNLPVPSNFQQQRISFHYITLEKDDDFSLIEKRADVSVHRLEYRNNSFFWKYTVGPVEKIKARLLEKYENLSESQFLASYTPAFSNHPLIICSSPGMGKTSLLKSLAKQMKHTFPERVVILLRFSSIMSNIKRSRATNETQISDIKDAIATEFSTNKLGKHLLLEMMNNDISQFELFLDGFDEISDDTVTEAFDVIQRLLLANNIRVYITSRRHLEKKLQEKFGVPIVYIAPFNEEDQNQFFSRYRSSNTEKLDNHILPDFASVALNSLTISNEDAQKFVEYPWHCFMLAEVYASGLEIYFSRVREKYCFPEKSVFEIFTKIVEYKFGQISYENKAIIRWFHWKEALKCLFPNNKESLMIQNALQKKVTDSPQFVDWMDENGLVLCMNRIYDVGILEPCRTTENPIFIHVTYAEYLLSELLVENLVEPFVEDDIFFKFLYETILETTLTWQGIEITNRVLKKIVKTLDADVIWNNDDRDKMILKKFLLSSANAFGGCTKNKLSAILKVWRRQTGEQATFKALVNELANLGWTECVDLLRSQIFVDLQQNHFRKTTICMFINTTLAKYKMVFPKLLDDWSFKNLERVESKDMSLRFSTKFKTCVYFGYKNLLEVLLNACSKTTEYDKMMCMDSASCQEAYIFAASLDDVEMFKLVCKVMESFGSDELLNINYTRNKIRRATYCHTPLHEAVYRGNILLSKHLLNEYHAHNSSLLESLWQVCLLDSFKFPRYVIKNKQQLLVDLKTIGASIYVRPISETFPGGIDIDLFLKICKLNGFLPGEYDLKTISKCVLNYFTNDLQMDKLVNWFLETNRAGYLVHPFKTHTTTLLCRAILLNVLSPKTLSKIHEKNSFDLGNIMGVTVVSKRCVELVKTIVTLSDVNQTDHKQQSLLHFASFWHNYDVMSYLIEAGANVNLADIDGNTPLHNIFNYSSISCNFDSIISCTELLTKHNAYILTENKDGDTPLHFAQLYKERTMTGEKIIDLLKHKTIYCCL